MTRRHSLRIFEGGKTSKDQRCLLEGLSCSLNVASRCNSRKQKKSKRHERLAHIDLLNLAPRPCWAGVGFSAYPKFTSLVPFLFSSGTWEKESIHHQSWMICCFEARCRCKDSGSSRTAQTCRPIYLACTSLPSFCSNYSRKKGGEQGFCKGHYAGRSLARSRKPPAERLTSGDAARPLPGSTKGLGHGAEGF